MGSFYDFSGKKQDVGYFIGAINVGAVVEEQKFKEQSDVILTSIKESPRAEDCDEIYLPGEIELNRAEKAQREGMEISDAVVKELEEISMKNIFRRLLLKKSASSPSRRNEIPV